MSEFITAQLEEWNVAAGFGFLRHGRRRIFLHVNDFSGPYRALKVGSMFRFRLGTDRKGRECAKNVTTLEGAAEKTRAPQKPAQKTAPRHWKNNHPGLRWTDFALLAGLLALPAIATFHRVTDLRLPAAWVVLASLVTFIVYRHDKRRAESGGWRVSELALHTLEVLGGWPGALLAQRQFRHKCSKLSYQLVFWLAVIAYQFIAFDSLNDWDILRSLLSGKK
jgi:uncharacterized membrane protein YsdA (DUF1294 family)/cold shock CspA family protein